MDISDEMQHQAKALANPSRFRLFRHIAEAEDAVGVVELTELLGFNHSAIRQHLAILVEAGLVAEATEVRTVRGRPRYEYTLRSDSLSAFRSVTGSYEKLAELLLAVVTTQDEPYDVGYRHGCEDNAGPDEAGTDAEPAADLEHVVRLLARELSDSGFDPVRIGDTTIELTHCPFAEVAAQDPAVVCDLHRGLIDGLLQSLDRTLSAEVTVHDSHRAGCRVVACDRTFSAGPRPAKP